MMIRAEERADCHWNPPWRSVLDDANLHDALAKTLTDFYNFRQDYPQFAAKQ
jgi:hypothetical protein